MSNLIKIIQEKRNKVQEEINFAKEFNQVPRFFIENDIEIYDDVISEIRKQQISDRFFLEEAIHRNINCWDDAEDYTRTLLFDWMSEFVDKNPLTEEERAAHLKKSGWDDDFLESAYFKSEKELKFFLQNKRLPLEEIDFSITDNSISHEA